MQGIQLTNTLSGKKEPFKPLKAGEVKMYACGVTTYDYCHIGHSLQAIYFDMIRNYLSYAGFKVTYVRNYTDVDDKIINRAAQMGISPAKLAGDMVKSEDEDMAALKIRRPDHAPKVSTSIPQIIAMTETLIANGAAYATKTGDVYYRVKAKKDYGKLSNRRTEELRTGGREIVVGDKEDELDFALWKKDDTKDASWDSPWGRGRPGWHIECSAMAKQYLGDSFDIHGGGLDLVFPHHENEIAQSESANNANYATYWLHCGLLTINKQKMSKSLGNQIVLRDFLKTWPAEALRLAFLQQHYRSNIDFNKSTFTTAHKRLTYYYATLDALDELGKKATTEGKILLTREQIRAPFCAAMNDDFNSALALGELNKAFKKANELILGKKNPDTLATAKELAKTFRELGGIFGLLQEEPKTMREKLRMMLLPELGITLEEIAAFMQARTAARAGKDFAKADQLRKDLAARGIEIMDTPTGAEWKIKSDE